MSNSIVIEISEESEYKALLNKKIENRMTWKEILYKGVNQL